jgi:hypothetical protein
MFDYNDFLESPQNKDIAYSTEELESEDDIVESQASAPFGLFQSRITAQPRRKNPKANSWIGPAKTMRFRFDDVGKSKEAGKGLFQQFRAKPGPIIFHFSKET